MNSDPASVRVPGTLPAARVCLFAASGQFVRRLTDEQAEQLRSAGLAEIRGSILRMIDGAALMGRGPFDPQAGSRTTYWEIGQRRQHMGARQAQQMHRELPQKAGQR